MICNEFTEKPSKEAVMSIKNDANRDIQLLSVDKSSNVRCILDLLETEDSNMEPIIISDDIEVEVCLKFWTADGNGLPCKCEELTHADAFLSSMKLWLYHSHLSEGIIDETCSYFEKSNVLLPLIALERRTTHTIKSEKYSSNKPVGNQDSDSSSTFESTDDEDLDRFIDNAVDLAVADISQDSSAIQAYYKLHKTNPPWQKDRGGDFACPSCNLDCKNKEGLQKHISFYHTRRPESKDTDSSMNTISDIVNDLKGNSVSTDNNSKEPYEKSQSEDESEANEWDRGVPAEKETELEDLIDNTSYSDHESIDREYEEIDYNSVPSDDEENQNHSSDNEAILKTDLQFEKNCFYCRKTFKDKIIYDTHYSQCYDRYAYMHM